MIDTKTDVAAQAAQIVGSAGIAPAADLPAYAVDGVLPAVVAMPDSVEQISRLLAFANGAGLALFPRGGGTAMGMGGAPQRVDIVLSMQRLAKVIDYSPEDMTVTTQAGVTLATIQTLLAGQRQMLPLDPPLPERATVGGILATNASGPLRYQFGMPRDLALGTVVVYADGTVAKSGGRTVKNVAGYDMTRLHVGAFGTLGVIVEATFKVSPLPKALVTVAGTFATLAEAGAAARALRMARIVPWSLALVPPSAASGLGDGYTVAVRLGGQPVVVTPQAQRALDTLTEAKGSQVHAVDNAEASFWPALRDWPATVGDANGVLLRIGVAPSQAVTALAAVHEMTTHYGLQASSLAWPGAATIFCYLSGTDDGLAAALTAMAAASKEWHGNLAIERCPQRIKAHAPLWGPAEADALTRRVKQTFDGKGVLNPGRFVGGL